MTALFRPEPAMPVNAYKTYSMRMPVQTHTRVATCKEVECQAWLCGWTTNVDVTTDLGVQQAKYIEMHSGRKFTKTVGAGTLSYHFGQGQTCFAEHRVGVGRPALFIVRGGDWRGNPSGERMQHARAEDWVEDFALHQEKIKRQIERG